MTWISGGGTKDIVGWKDPEVQIGGNMFSLVYVYIGKYHLDLFVVIQLWFRVAVPVAQDEKDRRRERRLNCENPTCIAGQACLVLKRHKLCQFICSILRRIGVAKEGRSTLCYHLIPLSSELWFLMQFRYKQSIDFVWWKTSNLLSHTNIWGCSVPRHMGPWRLAGSVLVAECSVCGSAVVWALGYIFSLGSHLRG